MAGKLEPFRQYNEHEVINLYRLDVTSSAEGNACGNMKAGASGDHQWDEGNLLCVSNGVASGDPVSLQAAGGTGTYAKNMRDYLGTGVNTALTHVANISYPIAELSAIADDGENSSNPAIGVALRGTMAYDENNEKLLYYTVKKEEGRSVLPGQVVPCLRRGILTFNNFSGTVGSGVFASSDGIVTGGDTGVPTTGASKLSLVSGHDLLTRGTAVAGSNTTVTVPATSITTDGLGSGMTLSIVVNKDADDNTAAGNIAIAAGHVTIVAAGSNYAAGDKITVSGLAALGTLLGADDDDLVMTLDAIATGTGPQIGEVIGLLGTKSLVALDV
jgi:hypothetical protein